MACETSSDNCPRPGDTDNILLRKILLALTSGAGVAGGQGIVEDPGGVVNFAQEGPYVPGAIPFATSPTTMGFDPTQLFWDDLNNRLGVGTDSPDDALHVVDTTDSVSALISAGRFVLNVTNETASIFSYFGVRALAEKTAGAGDITGDLRGGWFTAKNSTAQDIFSLYGSVNEVSNTGAGLVTQGVALFAGTPQGGGAFTQAVGLAINPQSVAGVVTGFAILQSGANDINSFAGIVATQRVQFPAVQVPSADANTLDDYEEGTWTPVDGSGAGLAFSAVFGDYVKIGRKVTLFFRLTYPVTANGAGSIIGGLPFTPESQGGHQGGYVVYTTSGLTLTMLAGDGLANFTFYLTTGVGVVNNQLSGANVRGVVIYTTAS